MNWLFVVVILNILLCLNGFEISNVDESVVESDQSVNLKFDNENGPGKPLYLSKYIKDRNFVKARRDALVKSFVGDVKSYSGYLTVNKRYGSNMFFWFFQSETDYKNAPTVIWLQGGPGCSMFSGVFNEVGPYVIGKNKIYKRKHTWSKISNLIFFDNPVGTGYSFTNTESGYATNQSRVGSDLYKAVVQLFKLFPYLRKNDLYIAGESYGGKYVPTLGHTIHLNNLKGHKHFMNLKGLLIGDGFTDPLNMLHYSDYLYHIGLIDNNVRLEFQKMEVKTAELIKQKKWHSASLLMTEAMGETDKSLFYKYTGFKGYYNYVSPSDGLFNNSETRFVSSTNFRRHLHVGNNKLNDGQVVYKHLFDDIPKSVIKLVEELLKHYKILFYNGQLDVLCAYPLTDNFLLHMKWPLSKKFKKAQRHIFRVSKDVAGYYKTVGNLTEMLIRNAGHMAPANQPAWTFQLFQDFITNKKFISDFGNKYVPYYKRKLEQ